LTIRRHLAELGLDWAAPAYSEDDPAGYDAPPLPPLEIEYGPLAGRFEHAAEEDRGLDDFRFQQSDVPGDAPRPQTVAVSRPPKASFSHMNMIITILPEHTPWTGRSPASADR
jgi:hypothetical protein